MPQMMDAVFMSDMRLLPFLPIAFLIISRSALVAAEQPAQLDDVTRSPGHVPVAAVLKQAKRLMHRTPPILLNSLDPATEVEVLRKGDTY